MLLAIAFAACRSRRTAASLQRRAFNGNAMAVEKTTMVLQPAPGAPPG